MAFNTFLIIICITVAYLAGRQAITRLVRKIGTDGKIAESRIHYVSVVLNVLWAAFAATTGVLASGLGFKDVGIFFGSAFAILGIAMFAQWSILSNVTASIIIFFFFPYRVGNQIIIIDKEDSIKGTIREITLFHLVLENDEDGLSTYPNSMVFQKAVKILNPKIAKIELPDKSNHSDIDN